VDQRRSVFSRAMTILGAFAGSGDNRLTLTAIADRTGLPLTTVHRLCRQLEQEGVLERTAAGDYRVGLRLWELGLLAPRAQGLREIALPYLEDLYEVTHQHVQLVVLDGTEAVILERLSARNAVRLEGRAGGRLPVHATSGGLVLLAHADEQVLASVLDQPLQRFTPSTLTDERELRATLGTARQQGWIALNGHLTPGSVSIAAVVLGRGGTAVGAVSVVRDATEDVSRLTPAILTTARGIARALRPSTLVDGSR
jgi:DNA-binding IclR family transcriptional regulator